MTSVLQLWVWTPGQSHWGCPRLTPKASHACSESVNSDRAANSMGVTHRTQLISSLYYLRPPFARTCSPTKTADMMEVHRSNRRVQRFGVLTDAVNIASFANFAKSTSTNISECTGSGLCRGGSLRLTCHKLPGSSALKRSPPRQGTNVEHPAHGVPPQRSLWEAPGCRCLFLGPQTVGLPQPLGHSPQSDSPPPKPWQSPPTTLPRVPASAHVLGCSQQGWATAPPRRD